jgi:hypothetical protein
MLASAVERIEGRSDGRIIEYFGDDVADEINVGAVVPRLAQNVVGLDEDIALHRAVAGREGLLDCKTTKASGRCQCSRGRTPFEGRK